MSSESTCYFEGCRASPEWAMVGANGYLVGYLCEQHKRTEYDTRKTHKTTLRRLSPEKPEYAMDESLDAEWALQRGQSPKPAQPRTRVDAGNTGTDRVEGGRENSTALTTRRHPAEREPDRESGLLAAVTSSASAGQALARYGALALTEEEQEELLMPVDRLQVEIRPDGIVYTPWVVVAQRFNGTLGVGEWALVPEGLPQLQDGFICWGFHLFVHGRWAAFAIGEHPDPGRRKLSLANRAEAAKSDALVKVSKALGVFGELWDEGWRQEWKREFAVRVYGKQFAWQDRMTWLWRRKDREPFEVEGRPGRTEESEYTRTREYVDDAREHMDAIREGD